MGKVIDETGKRYGKLTVIKRVENSKDRKARWLCKCDCGNLTVTTGKFLRNGSCKSCGCHRKEVLKRGAKKNTTHKETGTRLYDIWRGVKKRCRLKTNANYKYYGARGIDVFEEWYQSYESFRNRSLDNGYKKDLTIDRIDNAKGYFPDNCRWVDWKTQENNRRNTVYIEYQGEKYPRGILADKLNVSIQALMYRQQNDIPIRDNFKKFIKEEDLND